MTRRTLAALGIVLACLAALLAPARVTAQAAAEPDWRNLPYVGYDDTGYYFAIVTNAEIWKAYKISNVLTGYSPAYQIPEQMRDGKQIEAIWAKTCSATKGKKVTFSRTVQLAGKPGVMLLNVQRLVLNDIQHPGKIPISSVEVRLNDYVIARLKGKKDGVNTWKSIDVSPHRDLVKYGSNTLTVVATKAKTKKKDGFCASKTPDFGVAVELVGRPVADVRSSFVPSIAITTGIQGTATVTNAGPSYSVDPSFSMASGQEVGGANVTSLTLTSPTGTCETWSSGEGWSGVCHLAPLAPGASTTVGILMTFTMSCPGPAKIYYRFWAFNLWQDPDRTNDGREDAGVGCLD